MSAISVRVKSLHAWVQMVQTRMPFRYGSARLVRCPHLYLVAEIADAQGRTAHGIAADHLPPRWFDKDPGKSFPQEVEDQLRVIRWACEAALSEPETTPFHLWLSVYREVQEKARQAGLPALLAGFGPSLVERAVNDAVGHLLGVSLHSLLETNALGVELEAVDPALRGLALGELLPPRPLGYIAARHTVGLSDPIWTNDIPDEERLRDGLPQSLEEVVQFYGVRYFKIKIQNRLEEDLSRLGEIAALLDSRLADTDYHLTLDGNEQYESFEELLPVVEALRFRPELDRFGSSILFIEQPLARAVALEPERRRGIERVAAHYPVIIDESDDSLEAYPRAMELGYTGTSHKNCKNLFKSLVNLGRSVRVREHTGEHPIISAEDLSNIGVVALQEDLTALSTLGIPHAERNGHHYFRGLSHLSPDDQQRALHAHPGLYREDHGVVRLDVVGGDIDCRSLHQVPGLGVGAWPNVEGFTPLEEFDPRQMGV